MPTVWIIPETAGGSVKKVSLELLTVAHELADGGDVVAVLVGSDVSAPAQALASQGASKVLAATHPDAVSVSIDGRARGIAGLVRERGPDILLGPATFTGRDLTSRVAAELGVGLAQDATDVTLDDGRLVATRPIYAGKAIASVQVNTDPQIATIRPNSYPAYANGVQGDVESVALEEYRAGAVIESTETTASERPDVSEAEIIVSGGRGMGGPEHFELIERLADKLGAAVGASRAVVDAGWRPHSEQVGQTGKTVSPSLYVACGISGAVQHLAGMKTSQYIVAINKDAEAPIFKVADYGIVGDVFEVVPALIKALEEHTG